MLRQLLISGVVRCEAQVACITVNNGWVQGCVGMHECVNATAYSDLVCRNNYGTILTLLDGAYFADCCDEDSTVDTRLDQRILNGGIDIDITLLAADDTQTASVKIVRVQILIILYINAFV